MEEEGVVIVGMLVGLNVIDANLCVKGEDLDSQVTCAITETLTAVWQTMNNTVFSLIQVCVIDFSLYLKDPQATETKQEWVKTDRSFWRIDYYDYDLWSFGK